MTMRAILPGTLIAWVMFAATATLYAFPTDGVVAPVPETLADKTYELQIEHHGVQVMQGRAYFDRIGLQVGLGGGWEVGFDHHLGGPDRTISSDAHYRWHLKYRPAEVGFDKHWFNFKKQILAEKKSRPALAWGVLNIGGNATSGNYVVAGKHFGRWQLCLGWSDILDNPSFDYNEPDYIYEVVGYQYNDDWKFWAEHISRGGFSTSFAGEGRIADNLYLTAGWMRANNAMHDDAWILNLTYRGTWQ